jgi:hypothetical protein
VQDAVYWDILVAMRDQLRAIGFPAFGDVAGIPPEHIQIRMPPPHQNKKSDKPTILEELTPGILLTPARSVNTQVKGGSWNLDEVMYSVLIQLIDREPSRFDEMRMRAWLKWLEQIRKYFSHGNLKLAVFQGKGFVDITYCPEISVLDPKLFYVYDLCIGMIQVTAQSLEPRDEQATF